MQNIILLLFTIFFATGSYFLLAELCKVPSYRASKVILNAGRKRKKQVKDSDAFILELAEKLAKILPMEEYKRRKIAGVLKSAEISMTPEVCGAGLCESRTGTVRYHSMPDIHSTPVSSIPCIGNRSLFFREWECRKADKTKKGRNRVRTSEICSDHHTGTDGKQGYLIHAGKLSEECRPGTQE